MTDREQAIFDRQERAQEVEATYHIEQVSPTTWFVQHPIEDERAYLVDMAQRSCDCPDFTCRAQGMEIDCKHIIALAPTWERLTGKPLPARRALPEGDTLRETDQRVAASFAAFDNSDPFKD